MPSRYRRQVLVMTATITPPENTPLLARADPAVRRKDYQEALRFYLQLPTDLIGAVLFIENSGSELEDMREIARQSAQGKEVEVIGVPPNLDSPAFGKGYGEFKLLDQGLACSRVLRDTDILWKVTGRLKVLNMASLVAKAPADYELYCDLRSVPFVGDMLGGNDWMELRTFSCTVPGYDRFFRGQYVNMKGIAAESCLFRPVLDAWRSKSSLVVPRFRIQPSFAGHGGHLNTDYQGRGYRRKEALRRVGRLVAPWLWL